MKKLNDLLDAIKEFEMKYRGQGLVTFDVSALYDLFPDDDGQHANLIGHKWSKTERWPHTDRAGVYAVLDSSLHLLYIGESSWLGNRLSAYFKYAEDSGCRVVHPNWSARPRYVLTVAIASDTAFERFSLEQYLIRRLAPIDNTRGKVSEAVGA